MATGDEPPLVRVRAAMAATAVAEYFRARGKKVLLLVDSLSRVAMAQREIGLAAGEPPTSRGYPPSVFAQLPRLVERAGNDGGPGSITALYTVLAEGDDLSDPVVDCARAALDGHIVLSRKLANAGHFPAIDVLASVSRVMNDIVDQDHKILAREGREVLAAYRESADLIEVGAYVAGTQPARRPRHPLHRRPELGAAPGPRGPLLHARDHDRASTGSESHACPGRIVSAQAARLHRHLCRVRHAGPGAAQPPAGPTAPKEPEAPAARKDDKSDKAAAKPQATKAGEAPKAEAAKGEAPKGEAPKGEAGKADAHKDEHGHGAEAAADKPGKKGAAKPRPQRRPSAAGPDRLGPAPGAEAERRRGAGWGARVRAGQAGADGRRDRQGPRGPASRTPPAWSRCCVAEAAMAGCRSAIPPSR